jgi:hypothetical protein
VPIEDGHKAPALCSPHVGEVALSSKEKTKSSLDGVSSTETVGPTKVIRITRLQRKVQSIMVVPRNACAKLNEGCDLALSKTRSSKMSGRSSADGLFQLKRLV